jgi:hypothetical protein
VQADVCPSILMAALGNSRGVWAQNRALRRHYVSF